MEEAKSRTHGAAHDDGMQEIFLKIFSNPELDIRDKKAAVIDFITAGIETVSLNLCIYASGTLDNKGNSLKDL